MRTDFFNEALVTAMLAAASGGVNGTPSADPGSEALMGAETLKERLIALMDRGSSAAVQAGMPQELVAAADFAICAFIDELLLSSSTWPGRQDWLKKSLQFMRHGTATAGEDFFRLLDGLLADAEKSTPPTLLNYGPRTAKTAPQPVSVSEPLGAVLEMFALCLAQGFTGMYYNKPAVITERLNAIGRFVPAVGHRSEPFVLIPAEATGERTSLRPPLRRVLDLFRRFDPLDWLLWLIPPLLTLLLYRVCETRLDQLFKPFLQVGMLS